MNNKWIKKALPHIIAIVIFLVVSVIFCKPALDGNVLSQHDIIGWKGAAQNAFDYKAKNGHFPLWNTNVFSGMPNYQIAFEGKSILPDFNKIIGLGLPTPMNYFFIASLCFYILCLCFGLHPVVAIAGGLAYAFSTYNPIIIAAGHQTKMMAIAYMPLLLAGIILIYNRKYWVGLSVATLGAMLQLGANHPQVSYYFFIIAAAITIAYIFTWIKNKSYRHMAMALGLTALAAAVGMGTYLLTYLTTKEYAQYTMRGGKSVEIKGEEVTAANTKGLDHDYAMQYSMRTTEPLVMMMPNAFGGSSAVTLTQESNVIKKLSDLGVPETAAAQVVAGLPAYWGGMVGPGEVGTSGPPYIGAIIVLLAILGFVLIRHPLKWALLAVTVFSIFMSWGKFFEGFNTFLLNTLPLYNKFRAPSMALVICQFTLPLMAALTIRELFFVEHAKENLKANFRKILYTLGGVAVILGLLYVAQNYGSGFDEQVLAAKQLDQDGSGTVNRSIIAGMKADRQGMFGGQILRTILFMGLILGALYLYLKNIMKPLVIVGLLGFITLIDLWMVDKNYLGTDHFVAKEELETQNFAPTPIDEQLLKDKDPHFRVFDVTRGFNDNRAAYFHRSVLGYHAAKLRLYQDVLERYFSTVPNEQILNALDVKYIINQTTQGRIEVVPNPNAYGAVWLVKSVLPANGEVQELQAIGKTNLKDTAVVPAAEAQKIGQITADSVAFINLVKYSNDEIEYFSNAATPKFAVFSEVFYPAGWNAYIDGKKAEIIKTNYFMRGLLIPGGQHKIKMIFEPASVITGGRIAYTSTILFLLIFLGGFVMQWWVEKDKKTVPTP